MGKTKGLLQLLWGTLFMEMYNDLCNYYTLCGQKDNYGNTNIEMSLRELMRNWHKFIEKDTQLQTNACKMGKHRDQILADSTPKCQIKLAGEFIKYSGGYANNHCIQLSLDKKKGKTFSNQVSKRPYQETTFPKIRFVCFLYIHGNISLHTNWWDTGKLL